MFTRLLFFTLLLLSSNVSASEILKKHAEFQALHVEKTIEAINLAMVDAGDFLERNPDKNEMILHDTLAKYVERTPGLRAIIVMDKAGVLRIDSFTYPAKNIDLKDREYVKHTLFAKGRELYIGKPVIGRSSGTAFIPFSRPLLDADGNITGVIAGIISPGMLIDQKTVCSQCLVGVFQNEETLVTYPSNTSYPTDYMKQLDRKPHDSALEFVIQDQKITSWLLKLNKHHINIAVGKMSTD